MNETDETLIEKFYWIIADTINAMDPAEWLAIAKSYTIRKCRCLGKPNPIRPRPVSVEFYRQSDADAVFEYKYHLSGGIYVDKEFNLETENCRQILRLILQAAKQKLEFRYKSQMDGPKLVIDGR